MLSLLVAVAQTAAEGVGLIKQAYRCHEQGDDDLAVKYLEEALPMVEKFGPDYEAVLTFLGDIYMHLYASRRQREHTSYSWPYGRT